MKNLMIGLFLLVAAVAVGQEVDSVKGAREVDSLIQMSRTLTGQRNFEMALEVNAAAEKLALEKFGRESAAYGSCCFNHGRVLDFKGNYPEAEKWYLESKVIREKVLGKEHIDFAWSLNNLASLYYEMGNHEEVEPLYLEATAIREKTLGKEHPNYATSLNNLANLYSRMGNYEKVEPLHLEAKAIREKALGKQHPDYAQTLNNLANLYLMMGNYEEAEPLYLEAKAIREKAQGVEHPDYATSLNNIANLYSRMGNYEEAEPFYLEAKAIREKTLGKEHPLYGTSLNNLAILYKNMTNYEKVEPLYLEAKAILEKTLGKKHPNYAASLNNLANLYQIIGRYEKAELIHLEVKAIIEKALGKEHSDYAMSLENLAILYIDMGNYEKAELLSLEANAVFEKILGKEHPDYVTSLNVLANLYSYKDNYKKAEPLYLELSSEIKTLMENALHHLSEQELSIYLNKFSESQNRTLSFTYLSGSKKLTPTCYDNTLFYKAFLLNAKAQINRLAHTDSTSTEKFHRLKSYHRRLASQYALPIAERDFAKVSELEVQAHKLEKDLTRTVAGFGDALRQVKWNEVQTVLKSNEAAIEFVSFPFWNKKLTDSILYAALVLRPEDEAPHFVYLCTEAQLKTVLDRWDDKNLETSPAAVYWPKKGEDDLYSLLWQPLETLLPKGTAVWYSPAGLLHRLNLDAVSKSKYESLADGYTLRRIGSTRQVALPPTATFSGKEAALFGGLRYESDTLVMMKSNADHGVATRGIDSEERKPASPDGTRSSRDSLNYLENSLTEVQSISKNLKNAGFNASTFSGYAGTEEAFLQTSGRPSKEDKKRSPRILHVATHGYFFPDPKEDSTALKSPLGMEQHIPYRASDNPFIRSGLLLSGSEHAWRTGTPASAKLADGILTAADIAAMDLSNTELAVLSACETGLGDVESNEGVYGLQRAFKIAGSRYLIMSLWKVSDAATMELMTAFYAKWLDKKAPLSIPDAFRAVQKEMRKKYPDPFMWAGFVLME